MTTSNRGSGNDPQETGAGGIWGVNTPARGPSPRLDAGAVSQFSTQLFLSARVLGLAEGLSDTEYWKALGKANQINDAMSSVLLDVLTRFGTRLPREVLTAPIVTSERSEITWLDEIGGVMKKEAVDVSMTATLRWAELADQFDRILNGFKALSEANPEDTDAAQAYELLLNIKTEEQAKLQQIKRDNERARELDQQLKDQLLAEIDSLKKRNQELEGLIAQRPAKDATPSSPTHPGPTKPGKTTTKSTSPAGALPGRRRTPRK